MQRIRIFLTALTALTSAYAQECPNTSLYTITTDGAVWQICPETTFPSQNITVINSIKSRDECAQLCDQYAGCKSAVYDKLAYLCELKGNASISSFITDGSRDAIHLLSRPQLGQDLTFCPYGQTNVTTADGSVWAVCPNSIFWAATSQSITSTSTQSDCAQQCSTKLNCTQAVYDFHSLDCCLKTGPSRWIYDQDYQTIRLLYTPHTDSPVTVCSNEQNVTSSRGRAYSICQNSDFAGYPTNVIDRSQSAFDCMLACDSTINCTRASYNSTQQTCYLKRDDGPWVFTKGMQSIILRNDTSSYVGNLGRWLPKVNLPVVPAGAFVVPEQPRSDRIMSFASWGTYEFYGGSGFTQVADYNWKTGSITHNNISNTKHDMFCPGMSFLANGTMVISGGANAEAVTFYNHKTSKWTRAANLRIYRGYQASVTLYDGCIFTIGGSYSGGIGASNVAPKIGEVYNIRSGLWELRPGCDVVPILTTDDEGLWREDNHAWLYAWKNGSVFQAGPSKTMHWYDTNGKGAIYNAGVRDPENDTMCGINVMYDVGKIFSAGGSQSYTNSPAFRRAHLITLPEEPYAPVQVERLPDMSFERGFANVVVLPTGQVLITGGQATSLVFTDIQGIYAVELWDPVTKNFTILAPASTARNYHSVSLLLSDGSVWSAGGGMCPVAIGASSAFCDMAISHFDGEIFLPPYLFNDDGTPATRPAILSAWTSTDPTGYIGHHGDKLIITMQDYGTYKFSLVRIGSATHSVNTDQRRIPLSNVSMSGRAATTSIPQEPGTLIPGFYYLFAMDQRGTPGEAWTIQIL